MHTTRFQILAGFLADRLGPVNTLFLSFFLGGLFQLVYWPFAENYGSIIGFAALKGLTGSWFMVRCSRFHCSAPEPVADLASLFVTVITTTTITSSQTFLYLSFLRPQQSLIPVAAAQLFGLEGLATIVGFSVLVNSPGQMLGATLSGFVLSGSGGSYTAVACYSGGMMCGGSLLILYGESSLLAFVAETDPYSLQLAALTNASCSPSFRHHLRNCTACH